MMKKLILTGIILLAVTFQAFALQVSSARVVSPIMMLTRSSNILYAANTSFTAKVVKIIDGDTIDVLTADKTTTRVRLSGIDCPERKQPYGLKAKEFTATACGGKTVTVKAHSKDRYGRLIAEVILPSGVSLNQLLVSAGLAWWYRQYAPHDTRLKELEAEARADRKGLWQEPNPVAPWEYRKKNRNGSK